MNRAVERAGQARRLRRFQANANEGPVVVAGVKEEVFSLNEPSIPKERLGRKRDVERVAKFSSGSYNGGAGERR